MSSQKIVTQLPIMLETFTDADGSFTTAATFLLLVSSISIGIISVAYLRGNFTGKVLTSRFPPDTVVLHAFARPTLHPGIPSYSAYCLKLETYLRVSSIPYILCTDSPFSKKGKKPYITYNDIQIPDSQFSIKWLQEKYDVSIDKQVMPAGRSAMEAYRSMLEDGIGKQLVYYRWKTRNSGWLKRCLFPKVPAAVKYFLIPFLVKRQAENQRLTAHCLTEAEDLALLNRRFASLSSLLGGDDYFMSTKHPTSFDCVAFGFLCNFLLQGLDGEDRPTKALMGYPNLVRFVRRMGETWFPEMKGVDWEGIEIAVEEEAEREFSREEMERGVEADVEDEGMEDEDEGSLEEMEER